ncbi:MAG: hypothetical protein EOO01_11425 [Chitinophagaceae bacterium]|nr:MAG: hypothetical protein EOO01_11425 [Chitinophagaceae bacterium]
MEPFNIAISLQGSPVTLRVQPLEELLEDKHQYKIYKGQELVGTIWPELPDEGIKWHADNGMDDDTLFVIGEAIEKHDY